MWRKTDYGKESFTIQATKESNEWKMETIHQIQQGHG
jgi:hypothetical protein